MGYVMDMLMKRREDILGSLAVGQPELVKELRDVDIAISGVAKNGDISVGPYSGIRQAFDAIIIYLSSVGHPDTQENIVKCLMDGGLSMGPRTAANIRDSIRYHSRHSKKLTVVPSDDANPEERIGLPEWKDGK
jgi:hypothetical protein